MERALMVIQTPITTKVVSKTSNSFGNVGSRRLTINSRTHNRSAAPSSQSITTMLVAVVPPYIHGATMRAAKNVHRAPARRVSSDIFGYQFSVIGYSFNNENPKNCNL